MLAHSMQKRQLPLQTRRNTRGRTSKKHPPFAFHLRSHFRDSFRKPFVFSARCLLHPVLQSFVKLKHILGKGIHDIRKTKVRMVKNFLFFTLTSKSASNEALKTMLHYSITKDILLFTYALAVSPWPHRFSPS